MRSPKSIFSFENADHFNAHPGTVVPALAAGLRKPRLSSLFRPDRADYAKFPANSRF
jgi:hypothetical protein